MASYHLSVATISRAAGRSATAAAAYRAAERIDCEREGRCHDYTRKSGVEYAEIIAPENAPDWVTDRAALWNGAEASENRKNSVVAREWRVALPDELSPEDRRELALDFAHALVERFGVAADVAIHAPHREGDARNHHAHILTTTRRIGPEGFTEKTRELDDRTRGSVEIEAMREDWADRQNGALDRAGSVERVDHRSLEAQREKAEAERDVAMAGIETADPEDREAREAEHAEAALRAEALDREPEVKLGPATNAIERKEKRLAEREGREYAPRTERGVQVHASRQARAVFEDMRERLTLARETYATEREQGRDRISAGLEAIRAAASRDRGEASHDSITERLGGILERAREGSGQRDPEGRSIEERLKEITGQDATETPQETQPERDEGLSLDDILDERAREHHRQTLQTMYDGLARMTDPVKIAKVQSIIERLEEAGRDFDKGIELEENEPDRDTVVDYAARVREGRERVEHGLPNDGPLSEEELKARLDRGVEEIEQGRREGRIPEAEIDYDPWDR